MANFIRQYSLLIGKAGEEGTLLSDFQIEFDIKKSENSSLNKAEFRIYNLAKTTRDAITELESEDGILIFKVGYRGQALATVFTGNIIQADPILRGQESVVHLICGDGYVPVRDTMVNITFPEKTKLETVLSTLTSSMGLSRGVFQGDALTNHVFNNGLICSGKATAYLDENTKNFNLNWSIQDNYVNILPKTGSTNELAIDLSPATGLLGSPTRYGKQAGAIKGSDIPDGGVTVTSLLNPGMSISRKVQLESKLENGIFIIKEVNHKGSLEGGDWTSTAKMARTESVS